MGVFRVTSPTPSFPSVTSLSPASGSTSPQAFSVTFQNDTAGTNITGAQLLINNALDGRQACYVAYSRASAALFLVNDTGDAGGPFAGGIVLASGGTMSNSQCTVQAAANSVTTSGNNLTMAVTVTFTAGFAGRRILHAGVQSNAGNSDWHAMGAWVDTAPPTFSDFNPKTGPAGTLVGSREPISGRQRRSQWPSSAEEPSARPYPPPPRRVCPLWCQPVPRPEH